MQYRDELGVQAWKSDKYDKNSNECILYWGNAVQRKNVLCRFRATVDDSIYKTYCVFLFFSHVHASKSTQKCIHLCIELINLEIKMFYFTVQFVVGKWKMNVFLLSNKRNFTYNSCSFFIISTSVNIY